MGRIAVALAMSAVLALVAGCVGQRPTALDETWGKAFETAKHNQIINPEAGRSAAPDAGLDGVASEKAQEKYRDSFKGDKKEERVTILKLQ